MKGPEPVASPAGAMTKAQDRLTDALANVTSAADAVWAIVSFGDTLAELHNPGSSAMANSPYLAWRRMTTLISESAERAGIRTPTDPAAVQAVVIEPDEPMFSDLDLEDR